MRILLLILFPIFLHGQAYRLDSTIYTSPNEVFISKYTYITPRDFTVFHSGHHAAGFVYNDFQEYQDSLLIKWTSITEEGDSVFWNYSYDDQDRLISEFDYYKDTLNHADIYTYFENTDLITSREAYSIKHSDTINHYFEWHEYDDAQRRTYSSTISLRYDTLYNSYESVCTYPDDVTSFCLNHSRDRYRHLDTTISKVINYPDQYFGDTLRESYDFFQLSMDSSVISADNRTSFTWGDYNEFEDAGDWVYLHGNIYGNYQDYEESAGGYTFKYYESPWVEADPVNWRNDIEHLVNVIGTGEIIVNEGGLPVLKKIHWKENNVDVQTAYFYTELTNIEELSSEPDIPSSCRIINQLDPELIFYDMTGRRVREAAGTQFLIETSDTGNHRVLFIQE